MNPQSGRFVTSDPFQGFFYDPVSLHKYLYTENDPVNKKDPSGYISLSSLSVGLSTSINLQVATRIGAQFAISRAAGGATLRALGIYVERSVGIILTRVLGRAAVNRGVLLVGQGGRRVLDFWLQVGQRVAILEVKYKVPSKAGAALTRLVGQMKTALTAEEAARAGAQVVLFTYRAPSAAQMRLLLEALGPSANSIQHIHGFTGLIQWARMFFLPIP